MLRLDHFAKARPSELLSLLVKATTIGDVFSLVIWRSTCRGNPAFIVQNIPGAGSMIATNFVCNVVKPDGLTVGMPTQQIYMGEFVGKAEGLIIGTDKLEVSSINASGN